jgi:hypothetical protein
VRGADDGLVSAVILVLGLDGCMVVTDHERAPSFVTPLFA